MVRKRYRSNASKSNGKTKSTRKHKYARISDVFCMGNPNVYWLGTRRFQSFHKKVLIASLLPENQQPFCNPTKFVEIKSMGLGKSRAPYVPHLSWRHLSNFCFQILQPFHQNTAPPWKWQQITHKNGSNA
jgi:hypothetical protein